MVFQAIHQSLIILKQAIINPFILNFMLAEELDPVDPSQRNRIRFQPILMGGMIGNKIIDQLQPLFPAHLLLVQVLEIIQIVNPKLSEITKVPINSIEELL